VSSLQNWLIFYSGIGLVITSLFLISSQILYLLLAPKLELDDRHPSLSTPHPPGWEVEK
jgi:hypothetical protein